jgi:hypothetical protein
MRNKHSADEETGGARTVVHVVVGDTAFPVHQNKTRLPLLPQSRLELCFLFLFYVQFDPIGVAAEACADNSWLLILPAKQSFIRRVCVRWCPPALPFLKQWGVVFP